MINIGERDLKDVFKDFNNKDILIELNDGIEGDICIKDATVMYDEENGYINIIGENQKLRVNSTVLYRYQISEDRNVFRFKIDSQIEVKIKNKIT